MGEPPARVSNRLGSSLEMRFAPLEKVEKEPHDCSSYQPRFSFAHSALISRCDENFLDIAVTNC